MAVGVKGPGEDRADLAGAAGEDEFHEGSREERIGGTENERVRITDWPGPYGLVGISRLTNLSPLNEYLTVVAVVFRLDS